jgi:hypothetical protein
MLKKQTPLCAYNTEEQGFSAGCGASGEAHHPEKKKKL